MPRRADPRALLIATFDSQLKWVAAVGDELRRRGCECAVVSPQGRSVPSALQLAAVGVDGVDVLPWEVLVAESACSDVVVAALAGSQLHRLSIDLAAGSDPGVPGPVLVTGWIGVIFEQITTGYLARSGFDVVAVNSVDDLTTFTSVARQLDLGADNLLLSGLPFLGSTALPPRDEPIRRVLFADQPTVPGPAQERLHLYRRLIDYAYAHPEREVLLKPRHRLGEDTFHAMKHHPEDLLAGVDRPSNFRIDHTPISEILPSVDLLLTVSSTACLEAVGAGCRVGLVMDLGVQERYGNHAFLASGLLRTFEQLIDDDIGTPDPTWLRSYFFERPGSSAAQIVDRVEKLLSSGERPSRRTWESAYFISTARYRGALPAPGTPRRRRLGALARDLTPPVLMRRARRLRRRLDRR
ncbi:MAG TPA: DUF6716 putative glycosyltransferase [Microlunatus sp.]